MKRTTADNHVDNRYVPRDEQAPTPGTTIGASEMNHIQEELATLLESFGVVLDENEESQVAALLGLEYSKRLRYSDIQFGWIVSGLTASNINLDVTIDPGFGIAEGIRAELLASEASRDFSVPINSDSFVELKGDGTIAVASVANDAQAPTLDGLVIYKIVTDAAVITSIELLAKTIFDVGQEPVNVLAALNEEWVVSGLTATEASAQPVIMAFTDGTAIVDNTEVVIGPLSIHDVELPDDGMHVVSLLATGLFEVTSTGLNAAIPSGIPGVPLIAVRTVLGVTIGDVVNLSGYRRRSESPAFFRWDGGTFSCPINTDTDLIPGDTWVVEDSWGITKHIQVSGFYGFEIPEQIKRFRVVVRSFFEVNAQVFQQSVTARYGAEAFSLTQNTTGQSHTQWVSQYFDNLPGSALEVFGRQVANSAKDCSVILFIEEA